MAVRMQTNPDEASQTERKKNSPSALTLAQSLRWLLWLWIRYSGLLLPLILNFFESHFTSCVHYIILSQISLSKYGWFSFLFTSHFDHFPVFCTLMDVFRSWALFNKVLLSVLFWSHFSLISAHFSRDLDISVSVSNKYLFISFFSDSQCWKSQRYSLQTQHFLFTPRFSLYLAAISVSLLHLTTSNIWKADLSLKSIWLTLSGNSLVPL